MPPQSVIVPSFIQGVSTQADTQKRNATAKDILNGYPDIAAGLTKRNPTAFRHALSVASATLPYQIFWISSGSTRFVMFIAEDTTEPIQIFNLLTGVKATVTYAETYVRDYINAGVAEDRWRVLSVFDSTFVVNREVVTALKGSATVYSVNSVVLDISEVFDAGGIPTAGNIYKTLNSTVGRPSGFYEAKTPYNSSDLDNFIRLKSPSALSEFDETTMPMQLLYNSSTDTFVVDSPNWRPRLSGDSITNPAPSFIGRRLSDIVFHKSRLWFFADETVVSSRAGSGGFFNFWLDDYTNVTPADPIDEFITDEGINKILFSVPFSESMVLFTSGARQFEIRSVGPMAPDSISIIPTTDYGVTDNARPVKAGNTMYFLTPYNNYAQMMEYYYIDNAASNIAEDVTAHVQNFISEDVNILSADVNSGLILAHASGSRVMYPYKVKWTQNQKAQSAWTRWELADTRHVAVSSTIVNDSIWILLKDVGPDTTRYSMVTLDIEAKTTFDDVPYSVHLDMFQVFTTGTYDAGTDTTYWNLGYSCAEKEPRVITLEGDTPGLAVPSEATVASEHSTRVTVNGNYATTDVLIGIPYTYSVTLNTPYVKSQDVVRTGSFSLQKLILYVRDVVQFTLSQTSKGISSVYRSNYSSVQTGSSEAVLNGIPVSEFDDPTFIILGKATESEIVVSDTSEFPLTLVSAEFRGNFSPRRPVR